MIIDIPEVLETKGALKHVVSPEGYIHVSWKLPDGKVISFEYIHVNWPQGSLVVWDSVEEYEKAIEDVEWVMEGGND